MLATKNPSLRLLIMHFLFVKQELLGENFYISWNTGLPQQREKKVRAKLSIEN